MKTMSDLDEIQIKTPNGQIYGRSAGDRGNSLILGLHGWSQRNGWQTWRPLLQPLGDAGYYVVSVDLPGWGKSESWNVGPASTEIAKAAVLTILDALNHDSATLMGKSWGGGIAIQLALDEPQKVINLILTAPAFGNIDKLSEIRQPTLLSWSEDDPVIPFKNAGVYANGIPEIQTVYYKTGGHSAAIKNAKEFIPTAVEFLRRSPS